MTSLTTIVDIVDNLPPEPRLLSTWLRVLPRDADETLVEQVTAEVVRLVGFVQDYDHGLRRSAARARGGDAGAWFDVAAAFGAAVTLAVAVARPERSCHGPIDAFSDDVACSALWLAARAGQHYGYVAMLAIAVHLEDSRWTADMAGPDVFSSLSRAECLAGLAACLPMAFARDQARVSLGLDESPPKDTRVRRDQVADDHVLDVDCDIVELRERGSAVGRYRAAREGKMRNVLVDRPAKRPGDKPLPSEYRALETPLSLRRARSANSLATSLLAEFPWAEDLIDRLRADLVLSERLGRGHFQLRPTLIVGAPGSGKSRFAARLLDLTGVPGTVLSASGATDNRTLAGTAKGWSTAMPSLPVTIMASRDCANPVIIIEEIDKAGGSDGNGFLVRTLLMMTEPSTARTFLDEGLALAVDLSAVTWIMTCNRLDLVDPLLRTRCRILEMPSPRPQDFDVLMTGVLNDVAREHRVAVEVLPELEPPVVEAMRVGYTRGRLSARQLAALVRRALELSAEAEQAPVRH